MEGEEPGERPKWSVTWLLRVQRIGRNRIPQNTDPTTRSGFGRFFPWVVVLILLIEVGVLVWLGVLPR
jgi:hypothetical protein